MYSNTICKGEHREMMKGEVYTSISQTKAVYWYCNETEFFLEQYDTKSYDDFVQARVVPHTNLLPMSSEFKLRSGGIFKWDAAAPPTEVHSDTQQRRSFQIIRSSTFYLSSRATIIKHQSAKKENIVVIADNSYLRQDRARMRRIAQEDKARQARIKKEDSPQRR